VKQRQCCGFSVESLLFHVKHSHLAITLGWTYAAHSEKIRDAECSTRNNLPLRICEPDASTVQLNVFHMEQDALSTAVKRSMWNTPARDIVPCGTTRIADPQDGSL
jgi:hypothetical protein